MLISGLYREEKRMETKIVGYLTSPELAMSREHG